MTKRRLLRIVIADEQPIFRDGLRCLLETLPGVQIAGEVAGNGELAAMIRDVKPDIVLLGLPSGGSLQLDELKQTLMAYPSVRTILLAGANSLDTFEDLAAAAQQLSVLGVVPKDSPPDALFEWIEGVMNGRCSVGWESIANVPASVRRLETIRRRSLAFGLTRRQLEILRAVVAGGTNKITAQRFSISENTVRRHLAEIFDKVGVSNRTELAIVAEHHRLLGRG